MGQSQASRLFKNMKINGRRTSLNLQEIYWSGLNEISRREGIPALELICDLDKRKARRGTLTAMLRVYVASYFRSAAAPVSDGGSTLMAAMAALDVDGDAHPQDLPAGRGAGGEATRSVP